MTLWLGYGRKSYIDDGDRREVESTDRQRERLDAWAKQRGVAIESYVEPDGFRSGRSTKQRPEYRRMRERIRRAKPGEIGGVVVTRIDRTSRSPAEFYSFLSELADRGIDYVAIDQSFDTTTANGRLMLHMLIAVAAWEADIASERTREAIQDKQTRGYYVGPTPYGYDRATETGASGHTMATLSINPVEGDRVRALLHRYVYEREGCTFLSRWANAQGWASPRGAHWSDTTVDRMIDNVMFYAGFVKAYRGTASTSRDHELIQGHHPALISVEEARSVLRMRATRFRDNGGRKPQDTSAWPLTGHLICGECGSRWNGTRHWKDTSVLIYRCRKYSACSQTPIDALTLEAEVGTRLRDIGAWIDAETDLALADLFHIPDAIAPAEPIARDEIEQEIARLDYLFRKGRIAEPAYERERAALTALLTSMQVAPVEPVEPAGIEIARRILAQVDLARMPRATMGAIVDVAIRHIVVRDGDITEMLLAPELEVLRAHTRPAL